MNVKELRAEIIKKLSPSEEAASDASVIITEALNIDKTQLVIGDRSVSDEECAKIRSYAERAANGEPVRYIVGECEFMSLKFKVKKGVLIPRTDTEVLVETVIENLKGSVKPLIYDLCCGSGCIGLSLAKYISDASVVLADISPDAIETSRINAQRLGINDRVRIITLDVTKEVMPKEADCVVSNPPYIESDMISALDRKVRCFEPSLALDGGRDGLDFYRAIAKTAALKKGGLLAFEIGYNQGSAVSSLMQESGYRDVKVIKDLEDRDRVVTGYKIA